MPIADYNLWSTWQALYDLDAEPYADTGTRPHARLGYHRAALLHTLFEDRAVNVPRVLGWAPETRVVVVGCGFGWFLERMAAHGYAHLVGTDTSTLVHTHKALTEEADIHAALLEVGLPYEAGEGVALKAKLHDGGPRARVPILNEDGQTNASR